MFFKQSILHAGQRVRISFILQDILSAVVILNTTSPRPFSRLQDDVSSRSEKSCYFRFNSTRHYSRFRRTGEFEQAKNIQHKGQLTQVSLNGQILKDVVVEVDVGDIIVPILALCSTLP